MCNHEKIRKQIVLMVVLFLTLSYLGVRCPEASSSEITLRLASTTPSDSVGTRIHDLFAKSVMEKTKGKVKIEIYPANQLFSYKDLLQALPAGSVDMGDVICGTWTGIEPLFLFFDIPFISKSYPQWHKVLDSRTGEILKEEFEKKTGVKILYWIDAGGIGFASGKPLKTLEDFRGKRIRAMGEMNSEMIKTLGGSPVFLGSGELYLALQRGTIDVAISSIDTFWTRKFHEVTKYISCPNLLLGTIALGINKNKLDGLPKDVQEVMLEASKEAMAWERGEAEKIDIEDLKLLKEKGMDIYDPPEKERNRWKGECKNLTDLFLQRTGEKGKMLLEIVDKIQ